MVYPVSVGDIVEEAGDVIGPLLMALMPGPVLGHDKWTLVGLFERRIGKDGLDCQRNEEWVFELRYRQFWGVIIRGTGEMFRER